MLLNKIKKYNLILATQSPRRHFLMSEAGFKYTINIPVGIEEVYPESLVDEEIPLFLSELKASWFNGKLQENDIVITADTVVLLNDKVLGKPVSEENAIEMLQSLSGKAHDVATGVCFKSKDKQHSFVDITTVHFRNFTDEEICYYVSTYKPYDKAGSYGAQEWIGYIGIEWIEGSYFNVMGLPIQKLYVELEKFIEE
jgi:septum formation protein